MTSVNLIGDCHSTRVWEHWDPINCPVDFKVWGVAGMTAWAFDPEKFENEFKESSGIESGSEYCIKPRDYWVRPFSEFKSSDIVMLWLGYVDIRQWLPKHQNTEQTVIDYLDRITEYFKGSTVQLIEPLPQFTEMLLKYEGISPSYTYQERQAINGIFVKTLNQYAKDHNMLMPITQEEIKEAVGLKEFTPEDTATWAPHPQDSLKREYWGKIYNLFIKKAIAVDQKIFHVISPPGSGNTFAENLIEEYVEGARYESTHHNYNLYNKNAYDISIIRNPYEAIASSVELELNKGLSTYDEKENARFMNEIKYDTDSVLNPMFEKGMLDYTEFLNQLSKHKNVFVTTFESLTKAPEKFLNQICKKFNVSLSTNDLSEIQKNIISKMNENFQTKKRTPKDVTPLRDLINKKIFLYQPVQDNMVYEKYLDYKKEIEDKNND